MSAFFFNFQVSFVGKFIVVVVVYCYYLFISSSSIWLSILCIVKAASSSIF